ncbi:protein kinase C and casein kinase substrate in neurons protein 3 isoform X1 [Carcharodon carcharias]|uniref:protein kinase C and casein kinase substrate in neurons protein 3 isoform X1 n=2 Tax=Carcharodon carcharias TaxID=13397 RepID=UPI001B7E56D2|nr:protein kinase C and casein kinase substrate in neurons protein 3 isoform X1 [Carcharodon carcharias]XP_041034000.1 protein kinase C and casein kinase substrate in neurons protein 3 isoform X1 [Carcharodon carcharias]
MSLKYSDAPGPEATSNSFWMPDKYKSTTKRTDDGYKICNDIILCFQERAKIERQYALQISAWSRKWKPLVEASPMYGTLLKAWHAFLTSADRLSELHVEIQKSLVTEDTAKIRNWQREMYHKKFFGGFKETHEVKSGFRKAQKPWTKKLKKTEKLKKLYHAKRKKERLAIARESNARANQATSASKHRKLQGEREKCNQEAEKVKQRYTKTIEDLNKYNPKYMEEMEMVFDQSQQLEQKRIIFLKQIFLSIHRHLDVTNNESFRSIFNDLHQNVLSVNEQNDLKWWRNTHGPGMPTSWPHFQEWSPEREKITDKKAKGKKEGDKVVLQSLSLSKGYSLGEDGTNIPGIRIRALYDYTSQESDELSFKAGQELTKVEDEDEQGWCKGYLDGGRIGLYPANYVEVIQ